MSALELVPESAGVRWSSVRSCPRKACFEAEGAPARELTIEEQGWMWRGQNLGRDFALMLSAIEREKGNPRWRIHVASGVVGEWPRNYYTPDRAKAGFLCELPVPWALGTMHPDILVVETGTILEVLSSAHASDAMIRSKLLQLVGQLEHVPEAQGGAVVVVNPSQPLDRELFPIARSSKLYGELAAEMRDRIRQVREWRAGGDLPERVCAKPSEARGHFCAFAATCFGGWEQPDLPLLKDPEARELAVRLYETKRREHHLNGELRPVVSERKEIEQRLADIVPPGKHQAGGLEVARTHVQRKPSFLWEKAEAAGVFEPGLYDGFWRDGASYETWRVDRVGDEPLDTFGDEAPF